jgi:hypothetical protein
MVDWKAELDTELAYVPRRHLRQDDTQYPARPEGLGSFLAQAHVKNCLMAHLKIEESNDE